MSAYLPVDRVSREFTQEMLAERSVGPVPVLVHVMPMADTDSIVQFLADHNLEVLGSGHAGKWGRISTRLPTSEALALVQKLSAVPEVFFIERIHRIGFFNDRSSGTIQSGSQGTGTGVTPIWEHGIHGEGQIVGMIDSGLDVDACWFRDDSPDKLPIINTWSLENGYGTETDDSHRKVLAYDFLYSCDQYPDARGCDIPSDPSAWDDHGHGSHCAGSMVGDAQGGRNNGIAPAARIVVQDGGSTTDDCSDMPGLGCPVIDLYPIFEQAYTQGVRIHNNSYGDNENAPAPNQSNYSARAQDVDRFMWDHKDALIVFAAGNSGTGNRDFSVGSPSTNKNGLSVGSVRTSATATSDDDISSFSSRGWTADGRIKPDLMAPGCTVSAGSDMDIESGNCSEDSGCGTSYAAPVAVGAAALVRQYFADGFYPSGLKNPADTITPSAALLKGMLINGAVSLGGSDNSGQSISPIPSNEQGWGRIQLDRALLFSGAARRLYVDDRTEGFDAGVQSSVTYTFAGVSPAEPFKVTLVWTDYPGTVDSPPMSPRVNNVGNLNTPRLVNDLDLTVAKGSETYLGNVFSNGMSQSGGEADTRNTVEQVLFNTEVTEDITVTVSAANIVRPGQDYALIATGQWQAAGQAAAPDEDAGLVDAGQVDSSVSDAGQVDSSVSDAGQVDSGRAADAQTPVFSIDSGNPDGNPSDTPHTGGSSGDASSSSSSTPGTAVQDPPTSGVGTLEQGGAMQSDGLQASPSQGSSGCACRVSGIGSHRGGWPFLVGTALVLVRIRRRWPGKPKR